MNAGPGCDRGVLLAAGVEVHAEGVLAVDGTVSASARDDWGKEFLDSIDCRQTSVADIDAAIAHIRQYGSNHTDCILTEDADAAARFFEAARQRDPVAQCLDAVRRWG